MASKLIELEGSFRSADSKASNLEKVKDRMTSEIDTLQSNVDMVSKELFLSLSRNDSKMAPEWLSEKFKNMSILYIILKPVIWRLRCLATI